MDPAQSGTGTAVAGVGLLVGLIFIDPNKIRSLPAMTFLPYLHYSTSVAAWFSTFSIYAGYMAGGPENLQSLPLDPALVWPVRPEAPPLPAQCVSDVAILAASW